MVSEETLRHMAESYGTFPVTEVRDLVRINHTRTREGKEIPCGFFLFFKSRNSYQRLVICMEVSLVCAKQT